MARHRIHAQQRSDVAQHLGQVEPLGRDALPPEQAAHAVDDVAGASVVLADVLEDRGDLGQVGHGLLQEQRSRLGVAQDRTQRLVDLVRERAGQLAHHGDAPDVRHVLAQAQHLLFGQLALRRVDARPAGPDRRPAGAGFATAPRPRQLRACGLQL